MDHVVGAGTATDPGIILESGLQHDLLADLENGTFLGMGPDDLIVPGLRENGTLFDIPECKRHDDRDSNDIIYNAEPTADLFHQDHTSRVKALKSGVGMGKTSALAMDLMIKAQQQEPDEKGVRYTKWAVIRSTYAQLKTTTLRTFLEWMPRDNVEVVYGSPITAKLQMDLPDGTRVHSEFLFFPLDRPAQYANLLSLEITGCAINEVSEIRLASVLKYLLSRCGRYPPKRIAEATWKGAVMDFNPPPIGSWVHELFEKNKPKGYELYEYPPAVIINKDPDDPENPALWEFEMNPVAENVQNVVANYWLDLCEDYRYDWAFLQRFVLGEYTYGGAGRPVFSNFSQTRHIKRGLRPWRGVELIIGFDFGLYTACTIGQQQDKFLTILEAFSIPDSGLAIFLEDHLMPRLNARYGGIPRIATGDPSGNQRDAVYKQQAIGALRQAGFRFKPAPSNAIAPRLEAVNHFLRGNDMFRIDPVRAEELVNALGGAYHWQQNPTNEIIREMPAKDDASHVMDSCQYLCQYAAKGSGMNTVYSRGGTEGVVQLNKQRNLRRAGANIRYS